MRIDIQKYRENTCIYCDRHSKTLEFGKCPATKEDIYKCAKSKIFMNNMTNREERNECR